MQLPIFYLNYNESCPGPATCFPKNSKLICSEVLDILRDTHSFIHLHKHTSIFFSCIPTYLTKIYLKVYANNIFSVENFGSFGKNPL